MKKYTKPWSFSSARFIYCVQTLTVLFFTTLAILPILNRYTLPTDAAHTLSYTLTRNQLVVRGTLVSVLTQQQLHNCPLTSILYKLTIKNNNNNNKKINSISLTQLVCHTLVYSDSCDLRLRDGNQCMHYVLTP